MIDIHTHLKVLHKTKVRQLLDSMDEAGIEKSILLPLESPEANVDYYFLTSEAIDIYKEHPGRFIPFCAFDPRVREDFYSIRDRIKKCIESGCKGFGEYKAPFVIDDGRSRRIYEVCGEFNLPILMHLEDWDWRYNYDIEAFEKILSEYSETNFIAHGPLAWKDIVKLDNLLAKYANLYADISPYNGSGGKALKKDLSFTREFLSRHFHKILFGTDFPYSGDASCKTPFSQKNYVDFINTLGLNNQALKSIIKGNAKKLLQI